MMTYTSKLFVLVAFLVVMTVQNTYAQGELDAYVPNCPAEYMGYYTDCQGSLKGCSDCLEEAEIICRKRE